MQEITITIDEQGKATIDVKGVTGAECTDLTKQIEQALGAVEKRDLKPEYRQSQPQARKTGA